MDGVVLGLVHRLALLVVLRVVHGLALLLLDGVALKSRGEKDDATTSIRREEEKPINSLGIARMWEIVVSETRWNYMQGENLLFLLLLLRRSFNFLVPTEICTSSVQEGRKKGIKEAVTHTHGFEAKAPPFCLFMPIFLRLKKGDRVCAVGSVIARR